MKLEVGEYYLSASDDEWYRYDGSYGTEIKNRDLIAHIPKSLHLHILNEINSFYTDKDFMETVKSVW